MPPTVKRHLFVKPKNVYGALTLQLLIGKAKNPAQTITMKRLLFRIGLKHSNSRNG